jgi:DNA topoisomerase-1
LIFERAAMNAENFHDPEQFAAECGLVYVSDETPGIGRRRGRGFSYFDPEGRRVEDSRLLERVRALAIPPAWEDVWICPLEVGHLQATGRDSEGRKQYLYHARWIHLRGEGKFFRMMDFGRRLPGLRRQVHAHLGKRRLSREKVLATVASVLDETFIRVGNLEYSRRHQNFGLTTLRDRHVEIEGTRVTFEFQGKSGVRRTVNLRNRRLARIIRECREVPGYRLFQYFDEAGERRAVESSDVNEYLRRLAGENFTAKDFRTWGGSVAAVEFLRHRERAETKTALDKTLVEAADRVAERLGNTRAVCRRYYIHPSVFAAYEQGWLGELDGKPFSRESNGDRFALSAEEQLFMKVMRRHRKERRVESGGRKTKPR